VGTLGGVAARGGVGTLGGVTARGGVGALGGISMRGTLVPSAGVPVGFRRRLLRHQSSRPQLCVVSSCYLHHR
jgi:hypothetical protein